MNRTRVARFAGAALLAMGLATSLSLPAMGAPQAGQAAYAAMLQAMQRDLGLSAEGVLARIDQETRASAAEQALTGQLGSSFAGSWFDSSAGKLVVATTDASRIGQIHAAGANARLVSRSAAQLDAHKSALDRAEASAPSSVTGWYVDTATNSVVVSVLRLARLQRPPGHHPFRDHRRALHQHRCVLERHRRHDRPAGLLVVPR
jgi:streptogrisin C